MEATTKRWRWMRGGALAMSALTWGAGCGPETSLQDPVAQIDKSRQQIDQDPNNDVRTGRGYVRLMDSFAGDCITFDGPSIPDGTTGVVTSYTLEIVDSAETLYKKIGVTASGDVKFGLFGGDAKVKFARETTLSETSVYMLAKVETMNPPKSITNARLRPEYEDSVRLNAPRFREMCGDGFVSGMRTGGAYYALVQIETYNLDDKKSLSSTVNAHGGMWSARAEFEGALNKTIANRHVRVSGLQLGGNAENSSPCSDMTCALDRFTRMPTLAAQDPVLMTMSIRDYKTLLLPNGASPVDTAQQQATLTQLVTETWRAEEAIRKFQAALDAPTQHEAFDRAAAQQAINTHYQNLNVLRPAASACYSDYLHCSVPQLSSVLTPVPTWIGTAAPGQPRAVRLKHERTGQCLYNQFPLNGGEVHHWGCWADPNMTYLLDPVVSQGPNAVRLRHAATNTCIYGNPTNGFLVNHWSCWEDPNMVYQVQYLGGNRVRLMHQRTNQCLYAEGPDGKETHNWSCWEDPNMVFVLEDVNP